MVMIEFDTFELNALKKANLPETLRQKIEKAEKINNVMKNGIVFQNGSTSENQA